MNGNKKQIWAYLSMKKGTLDDDYYFYEDGTIIHHYDQTIMKRDIELYVSPSNIPDSEKEKIIQQCMIECPEDTFKQIKIILTNK